MQADEIRFLFEYHFHANRLIWDACILKVDAEAFTRPLEYSVGSIRNQCIHMMSVDERWISGMMGKPVPDFLQPEDFPTHDSVRARWDEVEALLRDYLNTLTDEEVNRGIQMQTREGSKPGKTWQVLLHVINHGTDHRAQILAMLFSLGAPTLPQDLMSYIWSQ
jgi:uncharacterized damage-inducible protein DinB